MTKTDQDKGIPCNGRRKKSEKCRRTRKTAWIKADEWSSTPPSPHIVVVIVIQLDIVAKGRVSVLVVVRVISVAVFVAMLTTPSLTLVAIVRIVVVVVHGFIVCVVPVLLLLLCLPRTVSHATSHQRPRLHLLLGIADIASTHLADPGILRTSASRRKPSSSGSASAAPFPSMST